MRQTFTPWAMIMAACLLLGSLPESQATEDDFREHVAPILQKHCLSCHNDDERKGEFSLQTAESALADGYIEAGDADTSYLMEVITPVDDKAQMPKKADPLSAEDIAAIKTWIDAGAKWPADFRLSEAQVADLDWWSLRPLERPELPSSWHTRSVTRGEDNDSSHAHGDSFSSARPSMPSSKRNSTNTD